MAMVAVHSSLLALKNEDMQTVNQMKKECNFCLTFFTYRFCSTPRSIGLANSSRITPECVPRFAGICARGASFCSSEADMAIVGIWQSGAANSYKVETNSGCSIPLSSFVF